jgi:hypothetical protein
MISGIIPLRKHGINALTKLARGLRYAYAHRPDSSALNQQATVVLLGLYQVPFYEMSSLGRQGRPHRRIQKVEPSFGEEQSHQGC